MITRRKLIASLAGLVAAPAIVRASSLDFIPREKKSFFVDQLQFDELGYYNVTEVSGWHFNYEEGVWQRTTVVRRRNEYEDLHWERVESRTPEYFDDVTKG